MPGALFSLEIELIEGGKQEVNDTGGQDKNHDGVRMMVEGMIEVEMVNELIEAPVFNLPPDVAGVPDGLGGGLRLREGGHPIPVGRDSLSTDRFGFKGADHAYRKVNAGPGGEALQVPPLILFLPDAHLADWISLAEAFGIGEEIGMVVFEDGDEMFVV